jgi:lipoprotein-releasing system permease protein
VIALCTTFIIFEGYEKTLKKTILGVNSHVYFFNPGLRDLSETDFEAISSFLDSKPEVRTYSGIISGQAIITHGDRSKGSFFKSIDWQNENQSSIYREAINVGEWRLFDENDVVIGHYLAKSLNVGVGDEISVMSTTSASLGLAGISYRSKRMNIVGIFYSGMYEYDNRYLFLNTETAKHFESTGSDLTMVEVRLHDRFINDASELAVAWGREFNHKYEIVSWIYFNGNLFSLLALEKWVLTIIISFLVMVASFNVITTTLASIEEKRKEIGLLKTIGLNSKKIAILFLAQINLMSIVCITFGILCGIGLGYLISYQTMIMLRGEVYLLDKIYIHVDFFKMCAIFAIAWGIINIAAIVPLVQIVQMSEINILRSKK